MDDLLRDDDVLIPRELLVAALRATRVGGEAFLDRDWSCFSEPERAETERYVEATFWRVALEIERRLCS